MDAGRPFMDENIVEYLSEARDTVFERDCRVEPEQRQIKVPSCDIFGLNSIRFDRAVFWLNTAFIPLLSSTFVSLAQLGVGIFKVRRTLR